jgi:hypothetical protein
MKDVKGLYYIIYPAGDKTKLQVLFLQDILSYELDDYSVASRKDFAHETDAVTYAKELAEKHNLTFVSEENQYLD